MSRIGLPGLVRHLPPREGQHRPLARHAGGGHAPVAMQQSPPAFHTRVPTAARRPCHTATSVHNATAHEMSGALNGHRLVSPVRARGRTPPPKPPVPSVRVHGVMLGPRPAGHEGYGCPGPGRARGRSAAAPAAPRRVAACHVRPLRPPSRRLTARPRLMREASWPPVCALADHTEPCTARGRPPCAGGRWGRPGPGRAPFNKASPGV